MQEVAFYRPMSIGRKIGSRCEQRVLATWRMKKKCRETEDCGYILHGWEASSWCGVVSSQGSCDSHRLNIGPDVCGSRGNNGVHSYRFVGR